MKTKANKLKKLIEKGANYGKNKKNNKKILLEFVSSNPTGPLHVGHVRGAVIVDVLSNILKMVGYNVTKEYYINDYGGQIKNFVESVYLRIREIFKTKPQNKYGKTKLLAENLLINKFKFLGCFLSISQVPSNSFTKRLIESFSLILFFFDISLKQLIM